MAEPDLTSPIPPNPMGLVKTTIMRQPLTFREKREVLERIGKRCVYCNCNNILMLTIEHKTPLNRGGTDEIENLTVSCKIDNNIKGSLLHEEYLDYLKSLTTLHDLQKVHIDIPSITVRFNQSHHPQI